MTGKDRWRLTTMAMVHLAFFAALGMAVKQMIYPMAAIALAPAFLPVAPFTSGAYMMWLSSARRITGYPLSGTFIGAVQAIVAFLLVFGRHGAFNIPLYIAPGLVLDSVFLIMGRFSSSLPGMVLATILASVTGTVMVVGLELEMGREVLIASILLSAASGTIGGYLAWKLSNLYDRTVGRRMMVFETNDPDTTTKGA